MVEAIGSSPIEPTRKESMNFRINLDVNTKQFISELG